jgi:hypothetical protein
MEMNATRARKYRNSQLTLWKQFVATTALAHIRCQNRQAFEPSKTDSLQFYKLCSLDHKFLQMPAMVLSPFDPGRLTSGSAFGRSEVDFVEESGAERDVRAADLDGRDVGLREQPDL